MTPRRVLMIAPTPFFADRGCHVQIAEEIWALQRKGYEILLVTYGLGRDVPNVRTVRLPHFPWYRKLGPGPSFHKFYLDPLLIVTTLRAARRFRPEIIHGHLHEGNLIGWVVRKFLGIPLLFDLQGSLTGELLAHRFPLVRPRLFRKAWYHFEEWINHCADVIVTQSTDVRNELVSFFHVDPRRVLLTYDGVNATVFTPQAPDDVLRRSLGIPPGRRVIVYLGTLTSYQGVDDLLAAFPIVQKAIPEAFLLLMGYPNEDYYRERARANGVSEHVLVTGRIPYEEAARYLTLGEIAVSPKQSATEANGKIYNYMACGLPTVAFDTVVNNEILGDLGVYAGAIGDVDGLAAAMSELLRDPERIRALSHAVREKAVAKYSWDAVADRIGRAYAIAQGAFAGQTVVQSSETAPEEISIREHSHVR